MRIVVRLSLVLLLCMPSIGRAVDAAFVLDQSEKTDRSLQGAPQAQKSHVETMAELAVFNALNAITPRYASYRWTAAPNVPDASPEAAVLTAHAVVLESTAMIDGAKVQRDYVAALALVPDGDAKDKGVLLGRRAALAVLAERVADAPGPRIDPPKTPAGPGVYQLTPGYPRQVGLELTRARPFAVASIAAFDPGPPPSFGGAQYLHELAEVKAIGAAHSAVRTADQTAAAIYWNTGGFDDVALLRNVNETQKLDGLGMARLLALKDMAEYDAAIAFITFKHRYNRWRPYTALHDRSAGADFDEHWEPLVRTHPHQDYPSAARTLFQVYAAFLDSLQTGRFEGFNETTGQTRSWESPQAMSEELGDARVWGGVHFRSASEAGRRIGDGIAREVLTTQLQRLDRPRP